MTSQRVACRVAKMTSPYDGMPTEVTVVPLGEGMDLAPHLYLASDIELSIFSRAMFGDDAVLLIERDLLIPLSLVAAVAANRTASGQRDFDLDAFLADSLDEIDLRCAACGAEPGESCSPFCIGEAAHHDTTGQEGE